MIYLISGFFSLLAVILITPFIIKFFTKIGIIDKPDNHRKLHITPIPRMGGIVIYFVIIIFTAVFYDLTDIKFLLTGSLLLAFIGAIDDVKGVKWQYKFLFQSVSSVLLIIYFVNHDYLHFNIAGYPIAQEFSIPILFLAIMGILNSFNLLDGLDGLVTGFSLIIASISFLLSFGSDSHLIPLLSIILIGTTLGFLKYNGNPARIFLGDTGSYILGYFSICVLFSAAAETNVNHRIDYVFLFLVFSLPVIDTLRVMLIRIKNKRNPFLPDNNHIHHIIYSKKIRHKTTVFIILGLTSTTSVIALTYQFYSRELGIILFALFAPVILFSDSIIELIIRKENLLAYGRMVKRVPDVMIKIYNNWVLPFVAFLMFSFFVYLILHKAILNDVRYIYLLLFSIFTLLFTIINIAKEKSLSDFLVFINFLLFFYVTGHNGIFYHLFQFPIIGLINLNQIITILLLPILGFFFVFRERILGSNRIQFLKGIDMILATIVVSVYLFIQISNQKQEYFKIADILVRSYMVFLFYKIVSARFPQMQFHLYFSTFIIVIMTLLKILIL